MIISDQYKFIFIHIPKTGGMSVRKAFENIGVTKTKPSRVQRLSSRLGINKNYKTYHFRTHGTLRSVEKIMPNDLFQHYIKFSVVRNPWDWLVSEYEYFKQGSEMHDTVLKRRRHRWVKGISDFTEFVYAKAKRDNATQYSYLVKNSGELGTDFVLHQETLADDFARLCSTLGLDCSLEHRNVTKQRNLPEAYFSPELSKFVEIHWQKDLQMFNYLSPCQSSNSYPQVECDNHLQDIK